MACAQETLALYLHRQLEQAGKGRSNPVGTLFDQLFQDRLNRAILQSVHSCFSMVGFQLHGIPDWTALAGAGPGKGSKTKLQTNFQTSRYTTPSSSRKYQSAALGAVADHIGKLLNSCSV
jgi:hypothetical protein